jgi:hypothetical protein
VIFNLQFVSFAIYPSGYLLGSLLGDSSENLERVVWCGEGSIAMGLVENMTGQTKLLIDLQGALVEFDRLFDAPCVSIFLISIQIGH